MGQENSPHQFIRKPIPDWGIRSIDNNIVLLANPEAFNKRIQALAEGVKNGVFFPKNEIGLRKNKDNPFTFEMATILDANGNPQIISRKYIYPDRYTFSQGDEILYRQDDLYTPRSAKKIEFGRTFKGVAQNKGTLSELEEKKLISKFYIFSFTLGKISILYRNPHNLLSYFSKEDLNNAISDLQLKP